MKVVFFPHVSLEWRGGSIGRASDWRCKDPMFKPHQEHKKNCESLFSQKCCADRLSVCPARVYTHTYEWSRKHVKDPVVHVGVRLAFLEEIDLNFPWGGEKGDNKVYKNKNKNWMRVSTEQLLSWFVCFQMTTRWCWQPPSQRRLSPSDVHASVQLWFSVNRESAATAMATQAASPHVSCRVSSSRRGNRWISKTHILCVFCCVSSSRGARGFPRTTSTVWICPPPLPLPPSDVKSQSCDMRTVAVCITIPAAENCPRMCI